MAPDTQITTLRNREIKAGEQLKETYFSRDVGAVAYSMIPTGPGGMLAGVVGMAPIKLFTSEKSISIPIDGGREKVKINSTDSPALHRTLSIYKKLGYQVSFERGTNDSSDSLILKSPVADAPPKKLEIAGGIKALQVREETSEQKLVTALVETKLDLPEETKQKHAKILGNDMSLEKLAYEHPKAFSKSSLAASASVGALFGGFTAIPFAGLNAVFQVTNRFLGPMYGRNVTIEHESGLKRDREKIYKSTSPETFNALKALKDENPNIVFVRRAVDGGGTEIAVFKNREDVRSKATPLVTFGDISDAKSRVKVDEENTGRVNEARLKVANLSAR